MRKESVITIDDRGTPLTFRVKEMSAMQLESWLMRAVILIVGSGGKTSGIMDLQVAGKKLLESGITALGNVDYEKAKPLLDELLGCCSRKIDGGMDQKCTPEMMDGVVQDVRTIFKLRMEALKLNLGFFGVGEGSPLDSLKKVPIGKPRKNTQA